MDVWMIGSGSITIKPQVDEVLIKEYIQFSKSCFPEEYEEVCEKSGEKYQQWKRRMF